MDGNGRIHRYLIHEVLANAGFTPRGIVLPISAVILANLDEYVAVLESFSRPVRQRTEYLPDAPDKPATGNDAVYFRYFDATKQAEFLYRALELFVRVVHQNNDTLSKTKKQSHFSWMAEAEVSEAEAVVAQAFAGTN